MKRIFIFLLLASTTALPAAIKEITGSQMLPMVTEALQKAFEISDAKLVLSSTRPLPTVPVPASRPPEPRSSVPPTVLPPSVRVKFETVVSP